MELVRIKRKSLFLLLILVVFLFMVAQILNVKSVAKDRRIRESRLFRNVIVHLDLKGSPPRIPYLISLLPELRSLGVTGLLMEYEDTFPYTGDLELLNGNKCYTADELIHFLSTARDEGFMIIPLIQTFGHMEFVLKHEVFTSLSETTSAINSICPSKPRSLQLIQAMLTQVIQFHSRIAPLKYFHVGCDEVFSINQCGDCHVRNLSDLSLFQNHVVRVTNMVRSVSPETTILIWDDMMRGKVPGDIIIKELPIEPVSWHYGVELKWLSHTDLHNYHTQFKNIWIATAFKGADGPKQIVPILQNRYRNHFSWAKILLEYEYPIRSGMSLDTFHGVILTGWSRYAHDQPQCELLPVAYPSLILNLITLNMFKNSNKRHLFHNSVWPTFYKEHALRKFLEHLKCTPTVMELNSFEVDNCTYDGAKLYTRLDYHVYLANVINELHNNVESFLYNKTYFGVNNMEHGDFMDDLDRKVIFYKGELNTNTVSLKQYLKKYFDEYIVNDYVHSISARYFKMLNYIDERASSGPVQQKNSYIREMPLLDLD